VQTLFFLFRRLIHPFPSVFVARKELPAFQDVPIVFGTLFSSLELRLLYRTEEQFIAGLRSILGDSEEIQEGDIASVISILNGLPRCPLDNVSAGDILRQYGWMIGGFHIRHPEHFAQHGQTYVDERLHRHSLSCDTILIHVYQEPSSIFQRPPLLYSPRDDDT